MWGCTDQSETDSVRLWVSIKRLQGIFETTAASTSGGREADQTWILSGWFRLWPHAEKCCVSEETGPKLSGGRSVTVRIPALTVKEPTFQAACPAKRYFCWLSIDCFGELCRLVYEGYVSFSYLWYSDYEYGMLPYSERTDKRVWGFFVSLALGEKQVSIHLLSQWPQLIISRCGHFCLCFRPKLQRLYTSSTE